MWAKCAHPTPMLSIARCRELVGPNRALTDDELLALRDQLYAVAHLALDLREADRREREKLVTDLLATEGSDALYDLDERAAIREYDGGSPRPYAEWAAMADVVRSRRH